MSLDRPIDELDRRLIAETQAGLPLVARPYAALAERLGQSSAEIERRLKLLLANGVIRRIGVIPNHYALGLKFNGMTVWDVADREVRALGEEVGSLNFVSHCYRRPRHLPLWPYNLFAMVHGRDRREVETKTELIAGILGESCSGRDILYSTRLLKKTGLRIAA